MSDAITLTLREPLDFALEADAIAPDRFAALAEIDAAKLPVWAGTRRAELGDFLDVRGARSMRVRVVGSTSRLHGLGSGMAAGELLVDGDAGSRVGASMRGGTIELRGNAGDDAGAAMSGGALRIAGSAGHRTGAGLPGASRGMTGGEIVVSGSVGRDTGTRIRRGLIVVGGDATDRTGRAMIAGTIIVLGRVHGAAGTLSKRGTIVAVGGLEVPVTYRYACTFAPPHLRLTFTYLRRRHGLAVSDPVAFGRYRRYCGDAGEPGKGEILTWVSSAE